MQEVLWASLLNLVESLTSDASMEPVGLGADEGSLWVRISSVPRQKPHVIIRGSPEVLKASGFNLSNAISVTASPVGGGRK